MLYAIIKCTEQCYCLMFCQKLGKSHTIKINKTLQAVDDKEIPFNKKLSG